MDVFPGIKHTHLWPEFKRHMICNAIIFTLSLLSQPEWTAQCFSAMSLFYCAHWQSYVSGTLRLGRIDVTEAQCTIMLIHILSAVFGPGIWMAKVCWSCRQFHPNEKKKKKNGTMTSRKWRKKKTILGCDEIIFSFSKSKRSASCIHYWFSNIKTPPKR